MKFNRKIESKTYLLHILIEVAIIQVYILGADEEQGFWATYTVPELVGPNQNNLKKGTRLIFRDCPKSGGNTI